MNVAPISNNQQSFKGTMYFRNAQKIIDNGGEQTFQEVKNLCLESKMISSIYDFAGLPLKAQKERLYQQLAELVKDEKESVKNSTSAIVETCNNSTFKIDLPTYKIWAMKAYTDKVARFNDNTEEVTYINKNGKISYCTCNLDWPSVDDKGPTYIFPADAL